MILCCVAGLRLGSFSSGGHWVVSAFGVLRIMLTGTWVYTFLCGQCVFSSPGYTPRSGIAASYRNSLFHLLRNFQTLPQWVHILCCCYANAGCGFQSMCLHPHQHLLCLPLSIKPSKCAVACHGFVLCFPGGSGRWASLCGLPGDLCILGETSTQILCPCLYRLFVFLILGCKSSLYIWEQAPYQINDLQNFSPILWAVLGLSQWCVACISCPQQDLGGLSEASRQRAVINVLTMREESNLWTYKRVL